MKWSWGFFFYIIGMVTFFTLFEIIVGRHFDVGWKDLWFIIPFIMAYVGGIIRGVE